MTPTHVRVAYGPREIADATGLPYRTITLLIRRGELRAIRAGKRLLVSRAELDRWLAGQPAA